MYPKISIKTKRVQGTGNTPTVQTPLEINSKMKKILLIKEGFKFFTRKDDKVVIDTEDKYLCKPILKSDGYKEYKIYKKNIREFFNFDDIDVKNAYLGDFEEKIGNFDRDYYFIMLPDVPDTDALVRALTIEKEFYYLVNLTGDNLESYLTSVVKTLEDKNLKFRVIDKITYTYDDAEVSTTLGAKIASDFSNHSYFKRIYLQSVHNQLMTLDTSYTDGDAIFGEINSGFTLKKSVFAVTTDTQRYKKFFIPPALYKEILVFKEFQHRFDMEGNVTLIYLADILEDSKKSEPVNGFQMPHIMEVNCSDELAFGITEELADNGYRISTIGNLKVSETESMGMLKFIRTCDKKYIELQGLVGVESADALERVQYDTIINLIKIYKSPSPDNFQSIKISYINSMRRLVEDEKIIKDIVIEKFQTHPEKRDVIQILHHNTLYTETKGATVTMEYEI